ncbi:MAG: hypothetical protein Q4C78_03515, partial [Synergistaceae bacterium]|nr:hypothetical protein [Synergistaceae bacterium]
ARFFLLFSQRALQVAPLLAGEASLYVRNGVAIPFMLAALQRLWLKFLWLIKIIFDKNNFLYIITAEGIVETIRSFRKQFLLNRLACQSKAVVFYLLVIIQKIMRRIT